MQQRDHDDAIGLGLHRTRHLHEMRRPLPLEVGSAAAPATTRPMRVPEDNDTWLTLNARSFARHPEQGRWSEADLLRLQAEPWFDADDVRIVEIGGQMAAACWMRHHAETTPPLGEIFVIGVDPDRAGQGLGRGAAVAGLNHVWARYRTPEAMLYVEADNAAAIGLYRSLGFTITHTDAAYELGVGEDEP